jgi:hypothetical protein
VLVLSEQANESIFVKREVERAVSKGTGQVLVELNTDLAKAIGLHLIKIECSSRSATSSRGWPARPVPAARAARRVSSPLPELADVEARGEPP